MPTPETALKKTFVVEFSPPASPLAGAVMGMKDDAKTIPPLELTAPIPSDDCSGYIAVVSLLLRSARQMAAERLLDRTKFQTEFVFRDTARLLSDRIQPVGILLAGDQTQEFLIEADYARGEGPFADTFSGVDAEEAEFQARWQMTENAGQWAHEDPQAFANLMARHRIRDVVPQPVPERRLRELLSDLVREAQAAGHNGPALEAAIEAASELNLELAPVAAPKM